ncbi:MAG: hypothetical protein GXO36_00405, partial [Chloroflexi bacterium]|nr:hypothetical protein [Chloroflexota bacterium]
MRPRKFPDPVAWLVLAWWVVPYGLAWWAQGAEARFTGVLINPLDGFSYLAKMQQGFHGAWRFRLPYTADPGPGAYLFLFHLFLGHVARWLSLPLLAVYHAARLSGAVALLAALRFFFNRVYARDPVRARRAFRWALVGSGLGGLLFPWLARVGDGPLDFWLAEAYPWLAGFANAHFPWALAAMLVLLAPGPLAPWAQAGLAAFLSLLSPFGVALALPVRMGLHLDPRRPWRVLTDR